MTLSDKLKYFLLATEEEASQKIKNSLKEIEDITNTPPLEIGINGYELDNYKKSLIKIADENLRIKNHNIDKKLTEMGLSSSSTALGAKIGLARERTNVAMDIEQKVCQYSIESKERILNYKRSILETLIGERDKKSQHSFNYWKMVLSSTVFIAAMGIFNEEIKSFFSTVIHLL